MITSLLQRVASTMLLSGISLFLMAGEIHTGAAKTELKVTVNTYQNLIFTSQVSDVLFRDVQTKLGPFAELFIAGYAYSVEPGDPKLPVNRKLIEVPLGASLDIQIIHSTYTDYPLQTVGINHRIIPQQAPVSKAITDPDEIPFVLNEQTYLTNDFLGVPLVSVTPAGTMRAVNLARLDVAPVQYNPVTGVLRVFTSIEVRVQFANSNEQATIARKQELFSPWFDHVYSQLANYKPLGDELITTAPVTYIIVSDPMFEDALQPFIDWKTRKGFKVVEAYTDDPAVGTTTTSISDYLEEFFTTPPAGYEPQSFVLFVGDVAQIPAFTGTAGNHPTDLYYCEYTGDKIPECYYGRFSANNLVQLQPQIDKTLEYEQYLFPDETFLGEVVMSAGADASHQMTWGNGQINYGTTYYFNAEHNILSHTYLQPEPGGANYSGQIKQNVSDGVAYANYTAHCSESGWADPSFLISDIPNLQNQSEYCLMVGNCCLSNRFNTNCFGEEQLRAEGKGSLGYIGGSNNTYWDEDYWWGVGMKGVSANPLYDPDHLGAYDVTFHDQGEAIEDWFVTQGQMVVGGNLAVEQSNSSMKTYYWEIYHLMGDPSLMVYLSIPEPVTAVYPDVLMIGSTSVDVTTDPYAYIGLSKDGDTFITAACADASGNATLSFSALTDPGYMGIVITKQNRKPLIDSIQIIPASGPYLTLAAFTVNDSIGGNNNHNADFSETITVDLSINNIGVATAYNVSATLSTSDTNVTVTNNTCLIDSIPPGGITIWPDAFAFTIHDFVVDQHVVACEIVFNDGNDSWTAPMKLTLCAPVLMVNTCTVLDPAPGGNNNGVLDPGESAILRIATKNAGHADVGNAIAHLIVLPASTPYIIVSNPSSFIGNLPVNTIVNVDFPVVTNGIAPVGTPVSLDYTETAGQLNQYTGQKQFNLELGAVPVYVLQNGYKTTCNAKFYDTGNSNRDYSNNENITMTFYPGNPGTSIEAGFTLFDVEASSNCTYDNLKIYNGSNILTPLIGIFCGTDSPGTIVSTATDGALTFKFHSDYADTRPGWEALIHCVGGPLSLMANAFPPNVCQGSATILSVIPSGGSGTYTYLWEPATYLDNPTSQFPLCTPEANITYTVTVNDGTGSVTSEPVVVTLLDRPDAPSIILNGDVLESDVADGNQWYYNGALIPGATSQTYQPALSGNYYATVADQITACESEPSNTIVYLITGVDPLQPEKMVSLYPNPFSGKLFISVTLPEPSPVAISFTDAFGRILDVQAPVTLPAGQHTLTIQNNALQPGLYYCRIETNAFSVTKKVLFTR